MPVISSREAAAALGVSYSTFKRWIHAGEVRTTRTRGGHHRVAEEEVARLLAVRDPAPARRAAPVPDEMVVGLSARNRLRGHVDEVRIDGLLAQVRLRIGDQWMTAIVTADAVRSLKLARGHEAVAIVKSTEVMIGVPTKRPALRRAAAARHRSRR